MDRNTQSKFFKRDDFSAFLLNKALIVLDKVKFTLGLASSRSRKCDVCILVKINERVDGNEWSSIVLSTDERKLIRMTLVVKLLLQPFIQIMI